MGRSMRDGEWEALMADVKASTKVQCKPQPGESTAEALARTYASALGVLQGQVTAALMSMTRTGRTGRSD